MTISNVGLDNILSFSQPVLSFLCPVSIVLILLAFAGKLFNNSKIVYQTTIFITCIPAIFDLFRTMPHSVASALHFDVLVNLGSAIFPFYNIGFGWLIPAIIGFVLGIIIYKLSKAHRGDNE